MSLSLSFFRCRRSLSFLVGILPIDVLVLDSKTGNEGHGMTPQQKKICDGFVYIKQYGAGTASLNVAVASSIAMHEFAKYHNYSERARSPLTGIFWHACRMILPNAWPYFKARFTSLPVKNSILPHQSSLAKSCLKKLGLRAVKKPKQALFPPRQMFWKILPLRVLKLPPRFLNGGIWQN